MTTLTDDTDVYAWAQALDADVWPQARSLSSNRRRGGTD
jgi:hypothetical protein